MTFEGFCQSGDNGRMSTYKLADLQWQKLYPFLQGHPRAYAGQEEKCRRFVEAVHWILRTGAQWRELPADLGKWNSVFKRYARWEENGVWADVQTVRARPGHGSGHARQYSCTRPYVRRGRLQKRGRQNEQCLGRSRGGFSSKIHHLVDALGLPLQFILTGGERHDLSQAESLLAPFHFDAAIGDKDYSSDLLGELVSARQVEVVIPSRRYRKQPRGYDRLRYKERNIVERFINRINSSTEPSGIEAFSPAMKNKHDTSWLSCTLPLLAYGLNEKSTSPSHLPLQS